MQQPPLPSKKDEETVDEDEEDDEEEHENTLCGKCGENYGTDEFWICCDICEQWFHGKCVKVTPAKAELIKQYKCPSCSNNKKARIWPSFFLGVTWNWVPMFACIPFGWVYLCGGIMARLLHKREHKAHVSWWERGKDQKGRCALTWRRRALLGGAKNLPSCVFFRGWKLWCVLLVWSDESRFDCVQKCSLENVMEVPDESWLPRLSCLTGIYRVACFVRQEFLPLRAVNLFLVINVWTSSFW